MRFQKFHLTQFLLIAIACVWSVHLVLGQPLTPVTVYLMDNGVRTDHEAFAGMEILSVDLVDSGEEKAESNGSKSSVAFIPPKQELAEEMGGFGDHATLLAGLVVERAPKVNLISVRTLNETGAGSWSEFIRGVHWITNHHETGQPAVANLSLGGVSDNSRVQFLISRAIDQLVAKGVVVVVAAGNDGIDDRDRIPSTLESVISVGAVSKFNARLDSSNYGTCVDVFALGKDLEGPGSFSAVHRIQDTGTSLAAAVVTGHLATRLEQFPMLSPAQVKHWVLEQSVPGVVSNLSKRMADKALFFEGR